MELPEPQDIVSLMKLDEGKLWVSVSYCAGLAQWIAVDGPKPITRYVYTTRAEAYKAKADIDQYGCGGGCEGWHTVEVALPHEKPRKTYDIERKSYQRYGGTIPEIFLLPSERARQQQVTLPGISSSAPRQQKPGAVYLIQQQGDTSIKIGHGTNAMSRLKQFQIGNARKLIILREIPHPEHAKLEKKLHKRYAEYKIRGEWFALPPEMLSCLLTEDFA